LRLFKSRTTFALASKPMTVLDKDNSIQIIIDKVLIETQKKNPLIIAIDGGSGAGKSTFVQHLAKQLNAVIVPLDDFYAADISNKKWYQFTVKEKLSEVFHWERLVTTAIKPLLNGNTASWTTFDFSSIQDDGTYSQRSDLQTIHPSNIIIIDGTYSASPAITDFIDITILIDVPIKERHKRLSSRESLTFLKEWHQRWDSVEDYYFNKVRPKHCFNFVIKNY
jgi:uridine kinase